MTTEEALTKLGRSTAEAVAGVLDRLAPGGVERGAVSVSSLDADPLRGIMAPVVLTSVSYVDGVTGGNLFVISVRGARRLAAAMMGLAEPEGDIEDPISELELSAVSEATNQMMAAAAGATSAVLGEQVEISVPTTQLLASLSGSGELYDRSPHQAHVAFSVFGESCRLVQLVPNAFVVRMGRALGDRAATVVDADAQPDGDQYDGDVMRGVALRVWAEFGRTTMQIGRAVGLGPGAVVEVDRRADDPVDVFVNGRRFATGRLLLDDDGNWAVRIEEVQEPGSSHPATKVVKEGAR